MTDSGALPSASLASFIAAKFAPHVPVTASSNSRHRQRAASASGSTNSSSHPSSSPRSSSGVPHVATCTSSEGWMDEAAVEALLPMASVIASELSSGCGCGWRSRAAGTERGASAAASVAAPVPTASAIARSANCDGGR